MLAVAAEKAAPIDKAGASSMVEDDVAELLVGAPGQPAEVAAAAKAAGAAAASANSDEGVVSGAAAPAASAATARSTPAMTPASQRTMALQEVALVQQEKLDTAQEKLQALEPKFNATMLQSQEKIKRLQSKLSSGGAGVSEAALANGKAPGDSSSSSLTLHGKTVFGGALSIASFDDATITGRRRRQALQRAIAKSLPGIDPATVRITLIRRRAA
jgi:hypothetical protein